MVGMARRRPIRILHVVGMMEAAGVETWLMHILRQADPARFQMDFVVHIPGEHTYDAEIRARGGALIPLPYTHQPRVYAREFTRVLREHGPYDVVHSHVHHFSGFVLRLAKRAGIPIRIAHSHLDSSAFEAHASVQRRMYLGLMRRWIKHAMTAGLSVSGQAARDLFGTGWERDPRHRLLFCGVPMEPFRMSVSRAAVRAEFGIPEAAFVIGHVGRFRHQKNHTFLMEIAAAVLRRDPQAYLLLVGDGELRPEIEGKVAALGITERVIFAGARLDVPRLMLGAMDAFLLPSLYEGLPLVLMEAQAAGLPCFFTGNISPEADIVAPLVHRTPLSSPASAWAETLLNARAQGTGISRAQALAIAAASPFNVRTSWDMLRRVYQDRSPQTPSRITAPRTSGGRRAPATVSR
jgi:glycosyltransferase involved in cell wall biosynthesis